ncbi:hypothetical protein BG011_001869 [Mortierella polycephala]|uniref:UBA domain-containing protein n=1 Tax=Mortierella polycephala TaxID=41804 RepID=A0A9P6Q6D0_9FUNG|nr:hypothetical protein BG011_001869 [Mortierella polycephala]
MDARHMALEKVPQSIQIRFSFPPYPGADLKTIQVHLPEGALLLDAIRQCRIEHHVPMYLEHSLLSTAQALIQSTRRAMVQEETRRVNHTVFTKAVSSSVGSGGIGEQATNGVSKESPDPEIQDGEADKSEAVEQEPQQEQDLKQDMETNTETAPSTELEPEPALQKAIIENYRNNTTQFYTQPEESMEVAQATWNSQLDDLQMAQRSKYQEFVLELYTIYKRRRLNSLQTNQVPSNDSANGTLRLDGKDMVAEAMQTIGARRSNVTETPIVQDRQKTIENGNKDLPPMPSPETPPQSQPTEQQTVEPQMTTQPSVETTGGAPDPPPKPSVQEDVELNKMIQSILEMGFDVEQAKGALLIANRNMDHAINMLLEQPENIPRLVLAKQKVEAMKENAKRQNRTQFPPQQPPSSMVGPQGGMNQGGQSSQKPWSPLPFLQQQKNALLTNNSNPSVKKFGGWLNKAIENLGLDDEFEDSSASAKNNGFSPSAPSSLPPPPASNLAESFTVGLGNNHSKVTHNLRLVVSDPAEVFPSHRVKTERDAAIQAQTASSLYGQNLTGLVQLVNIREWAKYKGEFFKACQTSTELHFDSIEKQLEALEEGFPLNGTTLREGDFIITRHSNLPMIHVVFHLFYGQPVSQMEDSLAPMQPNMFNQPGEFVPKPDFLAGLRNIIRTANRYEITTFSLPFLMMPPSFENQMVAPVDRLATPTRHHRHSSLSAASNAGSGSSAASSPLSSSLSNPKGFAKKS